MSAFYRSLLEDAMLLQASQQQHTQNRSKTHNVSKLNKTSDVKEVAKKSCRNKNDLSSNKVMFEETEHNELIQNINDGNIRDRDSFMNCLFVDSRKPKNQPFKQKRENQSEKCRVSPRNNIYQDDKTWDAIASGNSTLFSCSECKRHIEAPMYASKIFCHWCNRQAFAIEPECKILSNTSRLHVVQMDQTIALALQSREFQAQERKNRKSICSLVNSNTKLTGAMIDDLGKRFKRHKEAIIQLVEPKKSSAQSSSHQSKFLEGT